MFFRGFKRRQRATATRRVKCRSKPCLEALEDRTVPSLVMHEFAIPTANSDPIGIAFGPDGNIYFAEFAGNAIGRLTPTGQFSENFLPTPDSLPYQVVAGPDGAMWFTEQHIPVLPADPGGNAIGRLAVSTLQITETKVNTSMAEPTGITLGPDHNLWATEINSPNPNQGFGRIAKAVPGPNGTAVITEFTKIGNPNILLAAPRDITLGPDGNLWFTEPPFDIVGHISTNASTSVSTIVEFNLPSDPAGLAEPFGITAGPDGNLWVTEPGRNKIAVITPFGFVRQFTVPTANAGLAGITAGPDGNVWFCENNAGKIGEISTNGTFLGEFPTLTAGSGPMFIKPGPDGNLWFTESNANKIGEIIMPHTVVVGPGATGGPDVRVMNPVTGTIIKEILAYDPHFQGGVRVATGDVSNDGIPDIVTAPGPGGGPDIRVFSGITGLKTHEFMAYDPRFTGGVWVSVGDVNGDGYADIITGTDAGGGPEVKVFDGSKLNQLNNNSQPPVLLDFMAYRPFFPGGVRVAAADVSGTPGTLDIITGAGAGGGPHVEVWRPNGTLKPTLIRSFYAFSPNFSGGVFVSGGDIDADNMADVIVGAGSGPPEVKVFGFTPTTINLLRDFMAFGPNVTSGVQLSAWDFNGDARVEIVVSSGPENAPLVKVFDGLSGSVLDSFFAYNQFFLGGVFIGAH